MRTEGTLTKWNDERGFGFITPTDGGPDVFVHVSMFPKGWARPAVGEKITFEIETDHNGKLRAKNVLCPERPTVRRSFPARSRKPVSSRRKLRPGFLSPLVRLLGVAGVIAYGYSEFAHRGVSLTSNAIKPAVPLPSHAYSCDGRTHCSQMSSCAEATFFLNNCPGAEMDGNNDGVPCEQQWCGNGR